MTPADIARRRASKRFNERLKLAATFLNNSAIAILVGTLVLPYVADPEKATWRNLISLPVAFTLHVVAHWALTAFKSED